MPRKPYSDEEKKAKELERKAKISAYNKEYYQKRMQDPEFRKSRSKTSVAYQQKTGYKSQIKSKGKMAKRFCWHFSYGTDGDIIRKLEQEKVQSGYATYIKKLIRDDIKNNGIC